MSDNQKIHYEQILIVDDEQMTRIMLRRVLEEAGYSVLEAPDGLQGAEICIRQHPDAVLMDVRMPKMNGFEACRAIRQEPTTSRTPILMLTSLDDMMAVRIAFDAGATDFITKPINWVLLAQRVRYALRARQIELQMLENEEQLARAQRIARLGSWRYEIDVDWINLSVELCHLLEIGSVRGMSGNELREYVLEEDRLLLSRFMADFLQDHAEESETEIRVRLKHGRVLTLFVSANVMYDENSRAHILFGVAQDVTDRRNTEARLNYFAHFDPATGLPNRVLFRDRVAQAIAMARRDQNYCAVLSLTLDRFRKVHASFDETVARHILRQASERLQPILRASDTLSHSGGADFAMVLATIRDPHEVASIAQRMVRAFAEPIQVENLTVHVSINCGIALYPSDGDDVDTLLLYANSARARAQESHNPGYQFHTLDLHQRTLERLNREAALYQALERDEFILYFQPRLDLSKQQVNSVEALLRWQHPEWGLQTPDRFIDILEDTGLIAEVGNWVIVQACREIRSLPLAVSINLSPRQFRHPDLANRILGILREEQFPAERLELELTERLFMDDPRQAIDVLEQLRARGIQSSIDDYGTGYCSLQYLKQLPVNVLKIDRAFIRTLVEDPVDQAIVRSTIELCHTLDINVVAEGVEDRQTLDMLTAMGCDAAQGYYISRPLPIDQLRAWLRNNTFPSEASLGLVVSQESPHDTLTDIHTNAQEFDYALHPGSTNTR